jgi:hypothetical protein
MDLGTAAMFFAIGLGLAIIARNFTRSRRADSRVDDLPMRDGAVQMDRMVGRSSPAGDGDEESAPKAAAPARPQAARESSSSGPEKVRARRRKR